MQLVLNDNLINIEEAKENRKRNAESVTKKAITLARIHCRINNTEKIIKKLWEEYGKAFMLQENEKAQNISYQILALTGKINAYRECANLI